MTVTVPSFYMDETEITNSEYKQFVYWVKDSVALALLARRADELELGEEQKDGRTPKRGKTGASSRANDLNKMSA